MKQFYTPKRIIWPFVTILLFCVAAPVKAALPILSADTVSYGYDQVGNRISRGIIYLKSTKADSQPVDYKDKLGKTKITISPNPNGGRFTLSVTGTTETTKMKIYLYSLSGNLIYESQQPFTSTKIDISNYPNGMYILYLIIGNKKKRWKIIKE